MVENAVFTNVVQLITDPHRYFKSGVLTVTVPKTAEARGLLRTL